jgi:hypothetical protein
MGQARRPLVRGDRAEAAVRAVILVRGDSHYGRPEAMAWCEANGISYIFGFGGNDVLTGMVRPVADALCVRRAEKGASARRCCGPAQ